MFNLEQSIAEWRKRMLAAGIQAPVPLEELESHLRDEIEWQAKSGLDQREVFNAAIRQIGQAGVLKQEFKKVGGTFQERLKHFFLTLSGIPNSQLATNMNTSDPTTEPRWTTYFKTAAFAFPAVFLWVFSVVFLFPKLNEICRQFGGDIPFGVKTFGHTPAVFKIFACLAELMVQLTHYSLAISGAVVLMFALLEWRFHKWPRYRRAVAGLGVFFINAIVLASITMMLISVLIAVGNHGHVR